MGPLALCAVMSKPAGGEPAFVSRPVVVQVADNIISGSAIVAPSSVVETTFDLLWQLRGLMQLTVTIFASHNGSRSARKCFVVYGEIHLAPVQRTHGCRFTPEARVVCHPAIAIERFTGMDDGLEVGHELWGFGWVP